MKKVKKDQKKRKKQKINYGNSGSENETKKVAMILIGIAAFLGLFYVLAMMMTGEIRFGKEKKETPETEIQYDEILAGESLNQLAEEYYVLYYSSSEKVSDSYLSYRDNYVDMQNEYPMYTVDLERGFNTKYLVSGEEEIVDLPEQIKDLKVKSPTILRIKDGKVVERVEGKQEVNEFLKELN